MENKEIGKLFKEKLEQLNHSPNELLWENIKRDLNKKKKTRFMVWFYPLLFLGFLSGSYFIFNLKTFENKQIVVQSEIENTTDNTKNSVYKSEKINEKSFNNTTPKVKVIEKKESISKTINSDIEKNDFIRTKSPETKTAFKKTKKLIKSSEEYDVYEVTNKYEYGVKKKKINIVTSKLNSKKAKTISNLKKYKFSYKSKKLNFKKRTKIYKSKSNLKKDVKLNLDLKNANKLDKNGNKLEMSSEKLEMTHNSLNDSIKKIVPKKPIKKIVKNLKPKDSTNTVFLEPEEKNIEYYLTPFIGMNYYSVFKSNNLSQQYNENSKTGKLASTFGIYARAMFNKKAGVRFGFGISNLHYLISIDKTNQPILDYSKISLNQVNTDANLKNIFINDDKILLTQKMSCIEMPIDFYYIWKDKKFGFATATGFSVLLENQNRLTLKSNSVSEFEIGGLRESNSNVNFTANLGTYFTYKFNDRINFEVSPQFKYQLFGLDNSQGLNPIIFSLQTGFSYKLN